jgi:hypothetical protein
MKEMIMYRLVRVVGRNGRAYEVPMTAEQAAFYLRLAECRATTDPTTTFHEVVIEKSTQQVQPKPRPYN